MFRRIVTLVIVLPLAAIIIAFAVANRQWVTVSFDPFSTTAPAYAASLPLFALVFVLVILGVVVGGAAAWMRQSRGRSAARRHEAEVRMLQQEVDALRRRLAERPIAQASQPVPPAWPAIPPPAV